jgi:multiple antibiotic resistance protein
MISFFLLAFWTLFPIINPIGAIGPFLAMTERDSMQKRRDTAWRASLVCGSVLLFCAATGAFFFRFFGITVPALKVAGGILLLNVAIEMLNAKQPRSKGTKEEQDEGVQKEDVAVFPIAIPLLSGPGAIASVFMLADRASGIVEHLSIYLSILLTTIIVYGLLREAHRVSVVLGKIGLNILSRLMGLVLASTAVQFIFDGIKGALPGLG